MIVVLMVGAGAAWETRALSVLGEHPGVVVLRRCVDVDDLLASASSGQAQVAVVGLNAPGLDAAAVDHLRRHGVRPVAVVPGSPDTPDGAGGLLDAAREHARSIGVTVLVSAHDLATLPEAVARDDHPPTSSDHPGGSVGAATGPPTVAPAAGEVPRAAPGRVIAVWGPTGAPGRSTVACAVAGELARRGRRVVLLDADPYGGSQAQQLGIVDEVSGLLAASRLVVAGQLAERWPTVLRALDPWWCVVSGLPRPDRWVEVRPETVPELVGLAREHGDVVIDAGFSLEVDPTHDNARRPARNHLTTSALEVADEVVAVAAADPVGLARLARGLAELQETALGTPVRVVVNRMRPTLGWPEKDVATMVAGFARLEGVHFLPDDPGTVDRALVAGRALLDAGESAITRAVAAVVDALVPASAGSPGGRRGALSRRRAGRARPR